MRMAGRLDDFLTAGRTDDALRSFFEQLMHPLVAKAGAKAISEKTPGNAFVLSECLDLFPNASGVHVVRHPAAVVSSLMRVRERHVLQNQPIPDRPESPAAMLRSTLDYMKAGLRAAQTHPERVHVVRYESLVENPEVEIRAMSAKLGVEFSPKMLQPEDVRHPAYAIVESGTPWYTQQEFVSPISASKASAWKVELPEAAQADIRSALRENSRELEGFGYSL